MSDNKFKGTPAILKVLILLLLSCGNFIKPTEASKEEHLIQRLNYGVFFVPKGHFKPVSDHWSHTIQIMLPQYPALKSYKEPCSQEDSGNDICHMLHSALMQSEIIHNATGNTCRNLIEKIKNTIPEVENIQEDSRSKRSLLPFIGQLSKSIFGTATEADVQMLRNHISNIIKNSNNLEKTFRFQSKKLSSFMTLIDSRISNAAQEIQSNHKSIAKMGNEMWKVEYGLMANTEIAGQLARQVQESADMTGRINELVADIGQLMEGKISPSLVPPSTLTEMVIKIQKQLKHLYPKFQISYKHPSHYYKHPSFVAARYNNSVFITLKVPISAFQTSFKAYQIFSVPVPLNSTTTHSTQILDMPNFLAISEDERYYVTMSKDQWNSCHGKKDKYCPMDIAILPRSKYTCPLLIFEQMKELIPDYCNFRFVKHALKPSIMQIKSDQILISNTSRITLSCNSKWQRIEACNFCLMKVSCQCEIKSNHYYLPPMLHTCGNISNTFTKLHPVNLALLQYFHDPKTHNSIWGDTLFHTKFDPKIPPLNFFDGKYKHFVVEDRKAHLDLNKIAKAVKLNEDIYESSADSLLQQIPLETKSWSITSMSLGGVSFLSSIGLSIALHITCKRVNTLSAAVLTMQQIQGTKALPGHTIPPHFRIPANLTLNAPTTEPNLMDALVTTPITTYTIMMLCGIILLTWYLYHRYPTRLLIELTNGWTYTNVTIQRFPNCPRYWKFNDTQNITNVEVKGFLVPKVHMEWQDMYLTGSLNNQKLKLVEEQYITWWTAYKIRKIVKTPFCAFVSMRHQGYTYPLKMGHQDIENNEEMVVKENKLYPTLEKMN